MIEEQLQKSNMFEFMLSIFNLYKIFKAYSNQANSLPLEQIYPENLIYRLLRKVGVLLFCFIHNILNQVFVFL